MTIKAATVITMCLTTLATLPYVTTNRSVEVWVLHIVFVLLSGVLFYRVVFGPTVLNLIGGATFGAWWLFHTIGFARLAVLSDFDEDLIAQAYLLVTVGTAVLVLGYLLGISAGRTVMTRGSLPSSTVVHVGTANRLAILVMLAGFVILMVHIRAAGGIVSYFVRPYAEKLPRDVTNLLFVLRGIVANGAFFFALAAITDQMIKSSIRTMLILYILFHFVTILGSGGSGPVVGLALALFLFAVAHRYKWVRRVTVGVLLSVLLLALLAGGTMRQFRDDPMTLTWSGLAAAARPGRLVDFLVYSRSFDFLENTMRVIQYYPAGYGGAMQLIYPIVNLIPRAIYPGKPVGLGSQIVRDIYGVASDSPVGFAPGVLGELYYDLGYLLGVFALALCGVIIGLLQAIFRLGENDHPYGTALVTQLALTLLSFPNSYAGAAIRLGFSMVFWSLVAVGSRLLAPKRRRARNEDFLPRDAGVVGPVQRVEVQEKGL